MLKEKHNEKISEAKLLVEARRVLRRLNEKGAFLLLSKDMPNAAVFKDDRDGNLHRLTVTSRTVGEEFMARDWIKGSASEKLGRYRITPRGASALKRILQRDRALKQATSEGEMASEFAAQHSEFTHKTIREDSKHKRYQVNVAESPLAILARKRDKDGEPFLTQRQVGAGERLREDFEVSQIGPRVAQNWDRFLASASRGQFHESSNENAGGEAARKRLQEALKELGGGLSDIAFRCCCYLEGLETVERKLGWSARSGKVVLRIALERLADFYKIPERHRNFD